MYHSDMLKYYRAKLDTVRSNYFLALEKNDVDGVHDLRVALKRLKAFFNLVGSLSETFDAKKQFRDFRRIAKKTGGLRDSQVQLELLGEVNSDIKTDLSGYTAFLGKLEGECYERFLVFAAGDPLSKLDGMEKKIKRSLRPVTPVRAETKALGRFYNLRNDLVLRGRDGVHKIENLHKIRILSKEIHYTFEILNQGLHLFETVTTFVKDIKKVHQVLGKWHDYEVCLDHLNDFFRENESAVKDEQYAVFTKRVRNEKKRLEKKFESVIDDFVKKAVLL